MGSSQVDATYEEMRFLTAIINEGGKTTRRGLPTATRAQDKARQHCKQMKWARWAEFARPDGARRKDKQWGWVITPEGRRVAGRGDALAS